MKAIIKQATISFLVSGFIYALLMAAFDYFDEGNFSGKKFIFHFLAFGLSMGIFNFFMLRRQVKKQKEKNEKSRET
jgi:hypothetical protein